MARGTTRKKSPELDAALDELIAQFGGSEGVLGESGLLKQLTGRLVERALAGELTTHLGYSAGEVPPSEQTNRRNGHSPKRVLTDQGAVAIAVPRDRDGSFEPQLLPKHQRRLKEFDERILGLYARGMSVRDIRDFLEEQYGAGVSPTLISEVTDSVLEDVKTWRNRPLDRLYPVAWLDALHIKMRRNGVVKSCAFYVVLGLDMDGHRDVLGLWCSDNEGAAFWLSVLTELRNRGVEDLLIACCDGLAGLPEAIEAAFPDTVVQTCIVHKIRNSLRYVGWSERKAVARALRAVYTAPTAEAGLEALKVFEQEWGEAYPTIAPSWRRDWHRIEPFFQFALPIRRIIYTTNPIEGLNRQLRKATKTRGVFPSEEAVFKVLYLACKRAVRKWSRPAPHWQRTLQQLAIRFDGRVTL